MNRKIKIIYIAGYGFSGSTLLERMLAAHPQVVGCGEAYNLLNDFHKNEICSCGLSLSLCPHWKTVYTKYVKNKKTLNNLNVFSLLDLNEKSDTQYYSDSSKTTLGNMMRPYMLTKRYEVSLIHLSRNGVACLHSVLKRNKKSAYLKSFTVAVHWSMANLVAYLFKFFKPSGYYRIKYEDLIKNPDKKINEIHKFLNIDNQSDLTTFSQKNRIPRTHQLSGNAIRRVENLVLKTTNKTQEKRAVIPSLIFKFLSFPIYKLMSY